VVDGGGGGNLMGEKMKSGRVEGQEELRRPRKGLLARVWVCVGVGRRGDLKESSNRRRAYVV
jgi:hypothetical protein